MSRFHHHRAFARVLLILSVVVVVSNTRRSAAQELGPLATGMAGHAFDHLGNIGDQAKAAAASGATIIYASGFGGMGYGGLPAADELKVAAERYAAYVRDAKAEGIRLAIGYVCATSIVKLDTFDRNWTDEFRGQFTTPPAKWLQVGRDGKPLPSWYGGDYRPACMNNPDWRRYEKSVVRLQIESGHDGIFFDNPTVHPQGCYCDHCMAKFAAFLKRDGVDAPAAESVEVLHQLAASRPTEFMRFRCTIAADFLADMRAYARSIKPDALVTCNNSLNSPEAFFAQCRTYAYNIHAMSAVEDLVVVEDQATQPRVLADGRAVEYGPVYEMLHAIDRGKPLVAVTLADGDYHTPPNLVRLAMAEAAAHGASYLSWPTWPDAQRDRMIAAVRPMADFLHQNAGLLNGAKTRADALVFLPFRRWTETAECHTLGVARSLSAANVQFRVVSGDDLAAALAAEDVPKRLVAESPAVLTPEETALVERYRAAGGQVVWSGQKGWLADVQASAARTIVLHGRPTVRAVVRAQSNRTIVHLLNLDVRRVSSFEDRVTPVARLRIEVRCAATPRTVKAISADPEATRGDVQFKSREDRGAAVVELTLPRVEVSTILVIE